MIETRTVEKARFLIQNISYISQMFTVPDLKSGLLVKSSYTVAHSAITTTGMDEEVSQFNSLLWGATRGDDSSGGASLQQSDRCGSDYCATPTTSHLRRDAAFAKTTRSREEERFFQWLQAPPMPSLSAPSIAPSGEDIRSHTAVGFLIYGKHALNIVGLCRSIVRLTYSVALHREVCRTDATLRSEFPGVTSTETLGVSSASSPKEVKMQVKSFCRGVRGVMPCFGEGVSRLRAVSDSLSDADSTGFFSSAKQNTKSLCEAGRSLLFCPLSLSGASSISQVGDAVAARSHKRVTTMMRHLRRHLQLSLQFLMYSLHEEMACDISVAARAHAAWRERNKSTVLGGPLLNSEDRQVDVAFLEALQLDLMHRLLSALVGSLDYYQITKTYLLVAMGPEDRRDWEYTMITAMRSVGAQRHLISSLWVTASWAAIFPSLKRSVRRKEQVALDAFADGTGSDDSSGSDTQLSANFIQYARWGMRVRAEGGDVPQQLRMPSGALPSQSIFPQRSGGLSWAGDDAHGLCDVADQQSAAIALKSSYLFNSTSSYFVLRAAIPAKETDSQGYRYLAVSWARSVDSVVATSSPAASEGNSSSMFPFWTSNRGAAAVLAFDTFYYPASNRPSEAQSTTRLALVAHPGWYLVMDASSPRFESSIRCQSEPQTPTSPNGPSSPRVASEGWSPSPYRNTSPSPSHSPPRADRSIFSDSPARGDSDPAFVRASLATVFSSPDPSSVLKLGESFSSIAKGFSRRGTGLWAVPVRPVRVMSAKYAAQRSVTLAVSHAVSSMAVRVGSDGAHSVSLCYADLSLRKWGSPSSLPLRFYPIGAGFSQLAGNTVSEGEFRSALPDAAVLREVGDGDTVYGLVELEAFGQPEQSQPFATSTRQRAMLQSLPQMHIPDGGDPLVGGRLTTGRRAARRLEQEAFKIVSSVASSAPSRGDEQLGGATQRLDPSLTIQRVPFLVHLHDRICDPYRLLLLGPTSSGKTRVLSWWWDNSVSIAQSAAVGGQSFKYSVGAAQKLLFSRIAGGGGSWVTSDAAARSVPYTQQTAPPISTGGSLLVSCLVTDLPGTAGPHLVASHAPNADIIVMLFDYRDPLTLQRLEEEYFPTVCRRASFGTTFVLLGLCSDSSRAAITSFHIGQTISRGRRMRREAAAERAQIVATLVQRRTRREEVRAARQRRTEDAANHRGESPGKRVGQGGSRAAAVAPQPFADDAGRGGVPGDSVITSTPRGAVSAAGGSRRHKGIFGATIKFKNSAGAAANTGGGSGGRVDVNLISDLLRGDEEAGRPSLPSLPTRGGTGLFGSIGGAGDAALSSEDDSDEDAEAQLLLDASEFFCADTIADEWIVWGVPMADDASGDGRPRRRRRKRKSTSEPTVTDATASTSASSLVGDTSVSFAGGSAEASVPTPAFDAILQGLVGGGGVSLSAGGGGDTDEGDGDEEGEEYEEDDDDDADGDDDALNATATRAFSHGDFEDGDADEEGAGSGGGPHVDGPSGDGLSIVQRGAAMRGGGRASGRAATIVAGAAQQTVNNYLSSLLDRRHFQRFCGLYGMRREAFEGLLEVSRTAAAEVARADAVAACGLATLLCGGRREGVVGEGEVPLCGVVPAEGSAVDDSGESPDSPVDETEPSSPLLPLGGHHASHPLAAVSLPPSLPALPPRTPLRLPDQFLYTFADARRWLLRLLPLLGVPKEMAQPIAHSVLSDLSFLCRVRVDNGAAAAVATVAASAVGRSAGNGRRSSHSLGDATSMLSGEGFSDDDSDDNSEVDYEGDFPAEGRGFPSSSPSASSPLSFERAKTKNKATDNVWFAIKSTLKSSRHRQAKAAKGLLRSTAEAMMRPIVKVTDFIDTSVVAGASGTGAGSSFAGSPSPASSSRLFSDPRRGARKGVGKAAQKEAMLFKRRSASMAEFGEGRARTRAGGRPFRYGGLAQKKICVSDGTPGHFWEFVFDVQCTLFRRRTFLQKGTHTGLYSHVPAAPDGAPLGAAERRQRAVISEQLKAPAKSAVAAGATPEELLRFMTASFGAEPIVGEREGGGVYGEFSHLLRTAASDAGICRPVSPQPSAANGAQPSSPLPLQPPSSACASSAATGLSPGGSDPATIISSSPLATAMLVGNDDTALPIEERYVVPVGPQWLLLRWLLTAHGSLGDPAGEVAMLALTLRGTAREVCGALAGAVSGSSPSAGGHGSASSPTNESTFGGPSTQPRGGAPSFGLQSANSSADAPPAPVYLSVSAEPSSFGGRLARSLAACPQAVGSGAEGALSLLRRWGDVGWLGLPSGPGGAEPRGGPSVAGLLSSRPATVSMSVLALGPNGHGNGQWRSVSRIGGVGNRGVADESFISIAGTGDAAGLTTSDAGRCGEQLAVTFVPADRACGGNASTGVPTGGHGPYLRPLTPLTILSVLSTGADGDRSGGGRAGQGRSSSPQRGIAAPTIVVVAPSAVLPSTIANEEDPLEAFMATLPSPFPIRQALGVAGRGGEVEEAGLMARTLLLMLLTSLGEGGAAEAADGGGSAISLFAAAVAASVTAHHERALLNQVGGASFHSGSKSPSRGQNIYDQEQRQPSAASIRDLRSARLAERHVTALLRRAGIVDGGRYSVTLPPHVLLQRQKQLQQLQQGAPAGRIGWESARIFVQPLSPTSGGVSGTAGGVAPGTTNEVAPSPRTFHYVPPDPATLALLLELLPYPLRSPPQHLRSSSSPLSVSPSSPLSPSHRHHQHAAMQTQSWGVSAASTATIGNSISALLLADSHGDSLSTAPLGTSAMPPFASLPPPSFVRFQPQQRPSAVFSAVAAAAPSGYGFASAVGAAGLDRWLHSTTASLLRGGPRGRDEAAGPSSTTDGQCAAYFLRHLSGGTSETAAPAAASASASASVLGGGTSGGVDAGARVLSLCWFGRMLTVGNEVIVPRSEPLALISAAKSSHVEGHQKQQNDVVGGPSPSSSHQQLASTCARCGANFRRFSGRWRRRCYSCAADFCGDCCLEKTIVKRLPAGHAYVLRRLSESGRAVIPSEARQKKLKDTQQSSSEVQAHLPSGPPQRSPTELERLTDASPLSVTLGRDAPLLDGLLLLKPKRGWWCVGCADTRRRAHRGLPPVSSSAPLLSVLGSFGVGEGVNVDADADASGGVPVGGGIDDGPAPHSASDGSVGGRRRGGAVAVRKRRHRGEGGGKGKGKKRRRGRSASVARLLLQTESRRVHFNFAEEDAAEAEFQRGGGGFAAQNRVAMHYAKAAAGGTASKNSSKKSSQQKKKKAAGGGESGNIASAPSAVAYWVDDSAATACPLCRLPFTLLFRRRHHCRACGSLCCGACSEGRQTVDGYAAPQRVCRACEQEGRRVGSDNNGGRRRGSGAAEASVRSPSSPRGSGSAGAFPASPSSPNSPRAGKKGSAGASAAFPPISVGGGGGNASEGPVGGGSDDDDGLLSDDAFDEFLFAPGGGASDFDSEDDAEDALWFPKDLLARSQPSAEAMRQLRRERWVAERRREWVERERRLTREGLAAAASAAAAADSPTSAAFSQVGSDLIVPTSELMRLIRGAVSEKEGASSAEAPSPSRTIFILRSCLRHRTPPPSPLGNSRSFTSASRGDWGEGSGSGQSPPLSLSFSGAAAVTRLELAAAAEGARRSGWVLSLDTDDDGEDSDSGYFDSSGEEEDDYYVPPKEGSSSYGDDVAVDGCEQRASARLERRRFIAMQRHVQRAAEDAFLDALFGGGGGAPAASGVGIGAPRGRRTQPATAALPTDIPGLFSYAAEVGPIDAVEGGEWWRSVEAEGSGAAGGVAGHAVAAAGDAASGGAAPGRKDGWRGGLAAAKSPATPTAVNRTSSAHRLSSPSSHSPLFRNGKGGGAGGGGGGASSAGGGASNISAQPPLQWYELWDPPTDEPALAAVMEEALSAACAGGHDHAVDLLHLHPFGDAQPHASSAAIDPTTSRGISETAASAFSAVPNASFPISSAVVSASAFRHLSAVPRASYHVGITGYDSADDAVEDEEERTRPPLWADLLPPPFNFDGSSDPKHNNAANASISSQQQQQQRRRRGVVNWGRGGDIVEETAEDRLLGPDIWLPEGSFSIYQGL